jgi:hypothetical protein
MDTREGKSMAADDIDEGINLELESTSANLVDMFHLWPNVSLVETASKSLFRCSTRCTTPVLDARCSMLDAR